MGSSKVRCKFLAKMNITSIMYDIDDIDIDIDIDSLAIANIT